MKEGTAVSFFTPRRRDGTVRQFLVSAPALVVPMSKSRVRRLVVTAVVLLFAGGAALLVQELWRQRADDLRQQALNLLPHVAQRIQDFHRVQVDHGRKVWEVSASEAQYYSDERVVVVKDPMVSFFPADGRVVALRGKEGKVFLGSHDLRRIELIGGIDVQLGDYVLRTDYARYERDADVIVAPGPVRITGQAFELHGTGMEVAVGAQRLKLAEAVQMTWRPRT